MKHPFDLMSNKLKDQQINSEELITPEEADKIKGGMALLPIQHNRRPSPYYFTPPYSNQPLPFPLPKPYPRFPICDPNPSLVTTLALGEEGGSSCFW
jgi:hypothetical protein